MAAYPGWQTALLRLIGAPATPRNMRALNAWQRAEGGQARFNPLNTTLRTPGSVGSYNPVGVQNYRNPQAGIQATARTLLNPRYQNIVGSMRANAPAARTLGALANSPWGTGALALKVLGGGVSSGPTPGNVPAFAGQALRPPVQRAAPINTGPTRQALLSQVLSGFQAIQRGETPNFAAQYQLVGQLKGQLAQGGKPIAVEAQGPFGPRDKAMIGGVVSLAKRYLGTPYVWGGTRPGGFDCSGLLQYVWAQKGVRIPRTTYQQIKAGMPVRGALRPGDAVFFGSRSNPHHVGMYVGNGKFIESPHTGARVRISNLAGRGDYLGARRYA